MILHNMLYNLLFILLERERERERERENIIITESPEIVTNPFSYLGSRRRLSRS